MIGRVIDEDVVFELVRPYEVVVPRIYTISSVILRYRGTLGTFLPLKN